MPKFLKKFFFFLSFVFYYSLSLSPLYAQTRKWNALEFQLGVKCTETINGVEFATLQGIECIFANILVIIVPLAGLASFITLIIGGFQYLTSGGDPKQTQKAGSIITGAIIGLAVTMGIWFIFRLLTDITGVDLFWFKVPGPTP